jgi:hypothetical protein
VTAWPRLRDVILFSIGVLGVVFETVCRQQADYGMLPVYLTMIGFPAVLHFKRDDDDHDPTSSKSRELA